MMAFRCNGFDSHCHGQRPSKYPECASQETQRLISEPGEQIALIALHAVRKLLMLRSNLTAELGVQLLGSVLSPQKTT